MKSPKQSSTLGVHDMSSFMLQINSLLLRRHTH